MALSPGTLVASIVTATPPMADNDEVTGSFTPSNNSLLVAIMMVEKDDGNDVDELPSMGITDSAGLTWTLRAEKGDDETHPAGDNHWGYANGIKIWTAPVTTGTSMTVTFQRVSPNAYEFYMVAGAVVEYTGHDVASPIGVTGVATWDDNSPFPGATDGAKSLTLSGAPAATSEIIGGRSWTGWVPGHTFADEPTGYTELYDVSSFNGGEGGLQVQVRDPGSTSTTFGWDDIGNPNLVGIPKGAAIEIKEASGDDDTATPSVINVTTAVNSPTCLVRGFPSVIAVTATVNSATCISRTFPSVIAVTTTVPTAVGIPKGTPGVISVPVVVNAPTIIVSETITPSVIAVAVTVYSPTSGQFNPSIIAVPASTSSVSLLGANGARKMVTIMNDSASVLYVKFGTTASTSSFTYKVPAQQTLELPSAGVIYTGALDGIWVSAVGNAVITEMI